MTIALGQHAVKVDAFVAGTTTTATGSPTTTGSTFVIACASTFGSHTFSDNKGNTYTPSSTPTAINYNGTFRSGYLLYCQNGVGGAGHTFSCAGGTSESIILFGVELTLAATSGGPDANTTPTTGNSAGVAVQSITPVSNDALVLNFAAQLAGTATTTGTPWAMIDTGDETSFGTAAALSYRILATPSAVNDTLTFTGGSPWAAFAIAFASAGGGGGGSSPGPFPRNIYVMP